MSYKIEYDIAFKADYKKCFKKRYDMNLFEQILILLSENGELPPKYKTHSLQGNLKGFLECHIQSNWLLIWSKNEQTKTIVITRMGTHDDLF